MKSIRNSAKAVIIRDGRLLVIELRDESGPWFQLPGGGQVPGETLCQALIRECLEEVNALIHVGDLRYVREYIGDHHEFATEDEGFHQVDFMFACEILNPREIKPGHDPDHGQLGVRWLDIERLGEYRLYPLSLRDKLKDPAKPGTPVYLGDVN